ncbi:helix-turn-helix domain-containing protein [Lederbergia sp. NSJ-179]|uniref:helix-turn-helix transcriptional regulator n=1 Tax=Lederbergia sp. NSJ-179 TaxID=2931402 RepID=UPI001FD5B723|nr:helix-turn-helix transcriptional regulator [Lederbergia sp. NSJ-179]MCJ7840539.1 helix-turn-helix domain-containing protein [Lederbergia sp. NSJ-179]
MTLDKLRKIRINAGLTYQEVAEKVGITKEYYWMIENGKRRLSYEMSVKIASVFNSNPDDIFLN